jgi:hypothetical protein
VWGLGLSWTLREASCAKDLKKHNNQGGWQFLWGSQAIFLKALVFVVGYKKAFLEIKKVIHDPYPRSPRQAQA